MNLRTLFAGIFLLTIYHTTFSQNQKSDASIIGDVQCNGEHVPFINITLDGTTIGTTTDASGHYQLNNLPTGSYTLRVSGIGYKSETKEVTTYQQATLEMKFVVEEDVLNMDEVVVTANRQQSNRAEAPVPH